MHDHFNMFAAYNGWANRKLYEAVSGLSDADYRRDCQVAFTSLHGTLNHLVLTDDIWMCRFEGKNSKHTKLDGTVCDNFAELYAERRATDERIIAFCASVDDARLTKEFTYTPVSTPVPITQKLAPTLAHFFNHQTHHRGQAHAMLTRLAGTAPSLDLIYYQREIA